jgi:LysR family hydrogen peroxide-inducible transcriptional activator
MTEHALSACHLSQSQCINPFEATNVHTLLSMVENKLGVTFLPQMALNAGILAHKDMRFMPAQDDAYREIGLLWRKTTGRIRDFRLFSEKITPFIKDKCS